MSAIDFLKDAFRIAQKIDNVEDQNKIIDLSSLAMQQQEEIMNLKNEIREMKKTLN